MRKKKAIVYDDDPRPGRRYSNILKSSKAVTRNFDVERMDNEAFEDEMTLLEARRRDLRRRIEWEPGESVLDETSIFIVDYDLLKSFPSKSFLTGEKVAYLTRCFTTCGLIVGLNQYGSNPFDLTLKGHPESFADLNIGSKQLGNPGLWGEERDRAEFRPWHWPQLPDYLRSYEQKVAYVIEQPEKLICDVGKLKEIIETSPRSVTEFLGSKNPKRIRFGEFVKRSGNGLRRKDRNPSELMVAHISAARISKWMERMVLPGQDILVDAPHLVSRYPSLLQGNTSDIDRWNKTTMFGPIEVLGLEHETIEKFRFDVSHWLSRPAWFWRQISDHQRIEEVREPWTIETTGFRFCEDSSSFHKREECKEFDAGVDSPYVQRYVYRHAGVRYRPRVRLV